MKRGALALLWITGACAVGLGCSELLYRWPAARELIARSFGRGELLAIVDGRGIYDSGIGADGDVAQPIIAANLQRVSRHETISEEAIARESELIEFQFGNPKVVETELEASGLSAATLREDIAEHLRAAQWLEDQIAPQLVATADECRAFYAAHPEQFAQPQRFRVSHLFLAAPQATPPDIIQAKEKAIKSLAARVSKGEDFGGLIAEFSEDEATKERGGDLGFFSAARMRPDFIGEMQKLRPGKPTAPVRLHLGFHIFQLTDARPARQIPFEEVQSEIALHLTNAKRAAAVERLRERLSVAEFVRTPL